MSSVHKAAGSAVVPPKRLRLAVLLMALTATVIAAAWPTVGAMMGVSSSRPLPDRVELAQRQSDRPARPQVPQRSLPHDIRPRVDEEGSPTLFGPVSRPAPVVSGAAVLQPPASAPEPPLEIKPPYTAKGLLREAAQPLRALLEGQDGELLALRAGQPMDAVWTLEAIGPHELVLLHRPTQARHTLPLLAEP